MEEEKLAYTGFASVYDLFMDEIPYEKWCETIVGYLKDYGVTDGLVLELGCGTGTFTELMAQKGFDMIGVDNSPQMLEEAMEKRAETGSDILYLLQDMREFELYGTVRAIVSVCDSMNYLEEEEDLKEVFRLANNYLDPRGVLIFDMKTAHYYRDVMGDKILAENRDEGSFIWENTWYEEEQANGYELTLFIRDDETGLYEKQEEIHYQYAYDLSRVIELIEEAGMEFVGVYDEKTHREPDERSERVYFIAREKESEGKYYV